MQPTLSVIIPAYNEEKYIDACLASVVRQTTPEPYEIIVIDNNSTDQTAAKAKRYDLGRIHALLSVSNPPDGIAGPYVYFDAGVFMNWFTGPGNYWVGYYTLMKLFFGFRGSPAGMSLSDG